jgi:hypothetical protein
MGTNFRYGKYRPISQEEADQARALHKLAELFGQASPTPMNRSVVGQICHVLNASAIEINAGRGLPIGVSRAVFGLADSLRTAMDPRIPGK